MKKIICNDSGTIYIADVEDGEISIDGRPEVTSDAIEAVANHFVKSEDYKRIGVSGIKLHETNDVIAVFNSDLYEIKRKEL